jgi:hypothetical protein
MAPAVKCRKVLKGCFGRIDIQKAFESYLLLRMQGSAHLCLFGNFVVGTLAAACSSEDSGLEERQKTIVPKESCEVGV